MIDYDGLNRLAYQIKTETGRAANTALRVGTLFEDIIDALREGDNSDLINSINKINTDISKIINQIKDINNDIDQTIIKRIEAAERNITNIISNINTITGDINTINSTLSNHTTMIENINGQITTINNNLTTLSSQISNINSTISGISSDLSALTSRVTVNEADIADLRRQIINLNIDAIREAISNLQTDLGDLERRVTTLEGDVIDLRADLNAEIERAEATYAKKTDLPDMSDVFYKSKGGTVTARTTFTDRVTHDDYIQLKDGSQLSFVGSATRVLMSLAYDSTSAALLFTGSSAASPSSYPYLSVGGGSGFDVALDVVSKAFVRRPDASGSHYFHEIWDEGNDGSGSGLDADLLDGHHWTDFAMKSDLPDMSDVFYKSKGGTVGARTTFQEATFLQDSLVIDKGLILFNNTSKESKVEILRMGPYPYLSIYPDVKVEFGYVSHGMTLQSNSPIVRQNTSASYKLLDESNSVYVVSSYPTDLSSYPDGAIFIKTS